MPSLRRLTAEVDPLFLPLAGGFPQMYKVLLALSLFISPSFAELIVNPHVIGPIGQTAVMQLSIVEGTISDLGLNLDEIGPGQYLTFSEEIATEIILAEIMISMKVVAPATTPFNELYPEADKAIHLSSTSPMIYPESWQYYDTDGDITTLVGVNGDIGVPTLIRLTGLDAATWPRRLQMGTEWVFSDRDDEVALVPGLDVAFESDYTFTVDVEGTVVTPAGTHEALRLTKLGTEVVTYKDPQLAAAIGNLRSTILEHHWYTVEGFSVLVMRQEVARSATETIPPITQTTITRLIALDTLPTAVRDRSWANIKRYRVQKLGTEQQ